MRRLSLRFLVAAAIGITLLVSAPRVRTEPVPEAEAQKVRAIIEMQLQAFADDDAERAFEANTPGVREAFGSAGHFLALVRGGYPMILHPASISFMRPELRENAVLQLAEIVDEQGKSWLALFSLEQQPDGAWRIAGCLVAENQWRPA
jgi:hypothetical protein